jgi:hypothetical protein
VPAEATPLSLADANERAGKPRRRSWTSAQSAVTNALSLIDRPPAQARSPTSRPSRAGLRRIAETRSSPVERGYGDATAATARTMPPCEPIDGLAARWQGRATRVRMPSASPFRQAPSCAGGSFQGPAIALPAQSRFMTCLYPGQRFQLMGREPCRPCPSRIE